MTDSTLSRAPRLMLRVASGPDAGTRFNISDVSAVVGRSSECAIVLSDTGLSRRHFEINWDGQMWSVTDLASRNGITVNGRSVLFAGIASGDQISAGGTTLLVEGGPTPLFPMTAPTISADAPPPAAGSLLAELTRMLGTDPDNRLYALIDGAKAFEVAFMARLMGHDLYTLFGGNLARVVANVGPCLVALGQPAAFLAEWVERLGRHVGVLFTSAAALDAVHAHLRTVFVATDESGQEYFFRFYDPRVFRPFLPTCEPEELREFFGPVTRWVVETDDGLRLTSYQLDQGKVVQEEIGDGVRRGA